ncbi:hypothetical protein F2Q68_00024732 [Brassica cretica]|uniref:Uncharacterized protein n=1 Tax=Brassica cretica TaxID=69181 RepID=A0A8S9IAQ1_BRACR|nr:hypothetical protein F2Q68_00024732 [Brassica cretica]
MKETVFIGYLILKAERNDAEDEPHAKWGFSSAAVKETQNIKSDKKLDGQHRGSWFQRHAEQRGINKGYEAMAFPQFARSHFPKNTNPKMVNRNRRMLETIPYHSSGGDSDELIRAEDNVKERKLGEKESRSCRFLCSSSVLTCIQGKHLPKVQEAFDVHWDGKKSSLFVQSYLT